MSICKVSYFAVAALLVTALAAPARAATENVLFSFSDNPSVGNVDGTVTGEIFGLTVNGTSSASDVVILSAPAGIPNQTGDSLPIDLLADGWDLKGTISGDINTFTTNALGQIVGGEFDSLSGSDDVGELQLFAGSSGFLSLDTDGDVVASSVAPTFTPVTVPEPASLTALGIPAALALLRRKRQIGLNDLHVG